MNINVFVQMLLMHSFICSISCLVKQHTTIYYLIGPYYTGLKLMLAPLTLALIGIIFQMCTDKLS